MLALGEYHTCVILDTRDVKCWGYGFHGQLGYDSTDNVGDGGGNVMADLSTVNLSSAATAITTGGDHSCAVLEGGGVMCWGRGHFGQLGYDSSTSASDGMGIPMASLSTVNLSSAAIAISQRAKYRLLRRR